MILEEYCDNEKLIFSSADVVKKIDNIPKTLIGFYAQSIIDKFKETFHYEIITTLLCGAPYDIYKFTYKDKELLFTRISLGAPASVAVLEELTQLGISNFLISGSCGVLDENIQPYQLIIPNRAIRDEGTSYHYSKSSYFVDLDKTIVSKITKYLDNNKIDYKCGTTWTTDALYRETEEKANKRKSLGAICVDMECSALATFCKYRNVNYGHIFYGADIVVDKNYDIRTLINKEMDKEEKVLRTVIDCAYTVYEK